MKYAYHRRVPVPKDLLPCEFGRMPKVGLLYVFLTGKTEKEMNEKARKVKSFCRQLSKEYL